MPANIRVGGVRVDFSANDSRYQAVSRSVLASNARLAGSYRTVGRSAARQSRLVGQFTSSLQSSLIATIAYAAGVRALTSATAGSVRSFLDWEKGLVQVQKTTDLTDAETEKLGRGFDRLLTRTSALNRPLPVTSRELLEIAEVAGQMNVRGVPNLLRFTETVSLLGLTTDLAGRDAADALGLILANTDAHVQQVGRVGAVLTALGNEFRGGERDIIERAEAIARSTAEFQLSAQEILAFSAVFSQAGARTEKTGTVFQRSIRALVNAASEAASGSPDKLAAVADAANVSFDSLADTLARGDYISALRTLADALNNLEQIGGQDVLTRGSLLTLLFGGETPPVRIAEVLGVLAENVGEVDRALGIANKEWEQQIALLQEAGKFAEANALRLQAVQNRVESQARSVGQSLTTVFVPVAENFEVLELAIVGAGTALATRFAASRIKDASLLTGQLQIQAQVSKTAATAAQREVASVAAANQAANATGIRRIALAENLARAELKAAAATRVHVANTLALSRANRIGARASRAASAALAFVGGPIGLITTALSVGATAWLLWGNRADEATKQSDDLVDRLKGIVDEARNVGVTLNEQTIREVTERIARLNEELDELRQPTSFQATRDPFFGGDPVGRALLISQGRAAERRSQERIAALGTEIATLEELAEKARAANKEIESGADSAGDLGEVVSSSFRGISLALDDPTRQVREFVDELDKATQLATRRARLELSLAPLPQFSQELLTEAFERRAELQERSIELERTLNDAGQDRDRAQALEGQAEFIRDSFDVGTKARELAQRQFEQAQKQTEEQEHQVALAEQALAASRSQFDVDVDALEVLVRTRNLARNAQALNAPLSIDPPDLTRQSDAAENFTRQIQEAGQSAGTGGQTTRDRV